MPFTRHFGPPVQVGVRRAGVETKPGLEIADYTFRTSE